MSRYRSAAESRRPGYLKRRFDAIRRLQRMAARKSGRGEVVQLPGTRKRPVVL